MGFTKEQLFEEIQATHPEWSDEQVWTQVSVRLIGEEVIDKSDGGITDSIIDAIFEGARRWLIDNLPAIWESVRDWFSDMLIKAYNWFRERGLAFLYDLFTN